MKFSRVVSLVLTLTIVALSLFIPQNVFTSKNTAHAASLSSANEPVVADEDDFIYITRPEKNPQWVLIQKYVGSDAKIIIPETIAGYPVKIISNNVFEECKNLTYVKLPSTVTTVSGESFAECHSLLEIDIDPANEFFTVENGILYDKEKTALVAFPNGIGGEFTVPDGIITIRSSAFQGAYKLTKVNMHNSVTTISNSAFQCCTALKEIRLSDNLTVLGAKALANCVSLRELHLPGSLSIIGQDAILGDMGSNNDKFYYFTDGVYCVPNSFAYEHVYNLGVRQPYLKTENRSFTDIATGVQIIDIEGTLPLDKDFSLSVKPVAPEDVSSLIKVRYNHIEAYDISLICDEVEYKPLKELIVLFNGLPEDSITNTAKVYRTSGTRIFELVRSPHTPFVGVKTKNLGRYIVISNNDFTKKGDIDGDGVISSYDSRFALCLAAGLVPDATTEQIKTADVNDSGKIQTDDALNILKFAAGIIDSF